jgi:tRNA U34 5-methylaminomethyl-2-thiouridine-forming methyltransferase MnmC
MDQSVKAGGIDTGVVDDAVAQGGAYEVIRKRLVEQGKKLEQETTALNESRLQEFGNSELNVVARVRVRTENNCIARDIVQVGNQLLFGYNVFIGLKKETKIEDVFSLFSVTQNDESYEMTPVSLDKSFLRESSFVNDFDELYRYYKHTKLVQLSVKDGKLLAAFQIGERPEDLRVFRWSVSADGTDIRYIDNRGERDIKLPPSYDFEWLETAREDTVLGRYPHVNILDQIFVETINGDLTIKIENNTENGAGIYSEPVDDDTQSIDDASIFYSKVGSLILLKIKPYREDIWRYFIFNTLTDAVLRIDALGEACVQLPEDHGVIFPGGYYLQTGEFKTFENEIDKLKFKRAIKSPNGEDILYVFYEPNEGAVGLFAYNLIEKELKNPIYGHGYALAENGQLIIFTSEHEPTRVHPMQIWQTPYISDEFASHAPVSQSFLGKIGNAELVRGVSDLYTIYRMLEKQSVSSKLYEEISKSVSKIFDDHYWLESNETKELADIVRDILKTSELVLDEFEKVQSIQKQSVKTLQSAQKKQTDLIQTIRPDNWQTAEEFVNALSEIRRQRGHLITIKEHRYIDVDKIDALNKQLDETEGSLSQKTVDFLSDEKAIEPYLEKIDNLNKEVGLATTISQLNPLIESIESTASGLDLLSELMSSLKVEDPTVRTRIIESVSQVYSKLNQSKANAKHKQKGLGSEEAIAQFGAQFKLFSQSITNALGLSTTPEKCDEQLSRLLVQLEELESQFSEFDQFLSDIMDKREEIYESFEGHKQRLQDAQQRKAQSISDAANRILASIEKRSLKFTKPDELNTYFASDALVIKVREQAQQLRELSNAVKSDDIESQLKSIKEQALRSLRDKTDIYESGGNVIKLGPRHRFSVNTQDLDLTIIPRDGELNVHLTGTSYFEPILNEALLSLRQYWDISLESETKEVYRSEYLVSSILTSANASGSEINQADLVGSLIDPIKLNKLVSVFASPRYKEGYEKGIHDHDAAKILAELIPAIDRADLLTFDPLCRAIAQIFWVNQKNTERTLSVSDKQSNTMLSGDDKNSRLPLAGWIERAQSAEKMKTVFSNDKAFTLLAEEVAGCITEFIDQHPIDVTPLDIDRASKYLVSELARERLEFIGSKYAVQLIDELKRSMDDSSWRQYQTSLTKMIGWPAQRWQVSTAWLNALIENKNLQHLSRYVPEAVALLNADERISRRFSEVDLELKIEGLLGDHSRIVNQCLSFSIDEFLLRMDHHSKVVIPAYKHYLKLRQQIINDERSALKLDSFKAKPLSSFVRNRLINESYLPLIGDNFAKQMGTVGDEKRTDLMGLLMMISPPGYGKTTLMEYVANRLGLIFMKINCPSLGHDVMSLDPEQAPNATARQELEKLNLALEMGENVMLYLDDIQHTHPEFLQKFISLCDGTRRIEGVWKGQTKTYDMRGRKFSVVMAGNPYTESGEAFKIPDMLANRADIYNLGDILGGMDEQFSLSYIENSLTSNPVLAPLATREMADIYKLIDMAKGMNVAATDLSHQYSGAEINEITEIFKKMFVIQDVVLKINMQYIESAAQDDKYRVEPGFKLQGSYRNMNKMTEKISAVMNEAELMQMIKDHYLGEAQLLTTGAESNLLKLSELRGNMTQTERARWDQIKKDFLRNKSLGGDDSDVGAKVVTQLADLVEGIGQIGNVASASLHKQSNVDSNNALTVKSINAAVMNALNKIQKITESNQPSIEIVNQPVPGIDKILTVLANTIEHSIYPIVKSMDKKIDIDLKTHEKMTDISRQLRMLESELSVPKVKK